jgi:hypothetical protein
MTEYLWGRPLACGGLPGRPSAPAGIERPERPLQAEDLPHVQSASEVFRD